MALAVVLVVAVLALVDAVKPSVMAVDSNEAELQSFVSSKAAQPLFLLFTHRQTTKTAGCILDRLRETGAADVIGGI